MKKSILLVVINIGVHTTTYSSLQTTGRLVPCEKDELEQAFCMGSVGRVEEILEKREEAGESTNEYSLLCRACEVGEVLENRKQMLQMLVCRDSELINLRAYGEWGSTPFHHVVRLTEDYSLFFVAFCLCFGADPNKENREINPLLFPSTRFTRPLFLVKKHEQTFSVLRLLLAAGTDLYLPALDYNPAAQRPVYRNVYEKFKQICDGYASNHFYRKSAQLIDMHAQEVEEATGHFEGEFMLKDEKVLEEKCKGDVWDSKFALGALITLARYEEGALVGQTTRDYERFLEQVGAYKNKLRKLRTLEALKAFPDVKAEIVALIGH